MSIEGKAGDGSATSSEGSLAGPAGLGRRRFLQLGAVVGAAVASGAVVPAVADAATTGRVWRIPATGGDEAAAIQAAIDAAASAGGGTVLLQAGTHTIGTSLSLKTGVVLAGAEMDSTTLRETTSMGLYPIVMAVGTADAPVEGATVRDITIRNGTAAVTGNPQYNPISPLYSQDGIMLNYVRGFTVKNTRITEIAGLYGLRAWHAQNLDVRDSVFYRCTYAMLVLFPECEQVRVRHTTFDTVTSTTEPVTYAFSTGDAPAFGGAYRVRDVWVEHNTIRNIPKWQGLNTHGGENMYFRHNQIENVYRGIFCAPDPGSLLRNVVIAHNTMSQGTGIDLGQGIEAVGYPGAAPAENIQITHNHIEGFSIGVQVGRVADVVIAHNNIRDFSNGNAFGVFLAGWTFGAKITGNTFYCGAATRPIAGIDASEGVYGVEVSGNSIDAASKDVAALLFIDGAGVNQSWQIRPDNRVVLIQDTVAYANLAYLPIFKDAEPTSGLQQKHGDLIYDSDWKPRWTVSSPAIGYGAFDTTTVQLTVDMAAGSTQATAVLAGSDGAILPPGMNVTIAGTGPNGHDLPARVAAITEQYYYIQNGVVYFPITITFDAPAATTVTGAAVTYQPLVLTALS